VASKIENSLLGVFCGRRGWKPSSFKSHNFGDRLRKIANDYDGSSDLDEIDIKIKPDFYFISKKRLIILEVQTSNFFTPRKLYNYAWLFFCMDCDFFYGLEVVELYGITYGGTEFRYDINTVIEGLYSNV
jgi:hypothetical protein